MNRAVVINREFGKLYEKNFRGVILLILKYVNDYHIAEDLAQECFLRVFERFHNSDLCLESAKNYLYKSAKHAAIDYKRKSARDAVRDQKAFVDLKELHHDFYEKVENYVIEGEVVSTVHDVLSEFPDRARQIIIDRVMHEINLT